MEIRKRDTGVIPVIRLDDDIKGSSSNINLKQKTDKSKNEIKKVNKVFFDKGDDKINNETYDGIIPIKDLSADDHNLNTSYLSAEQNDVVLFEDSSGIIDYSKESVSFDSKLEEYKNIKRIGRGKLVIEKEGISFYIEKKFFRFDFHRIDDIKSGTTYMALYLKGSNSVRLFIFQKGNDLISSIKKKYMDYVSELAK